MNEWTIERLYDCLMIEQKEANYLFILLVVVEDMYNIYSIPHLMWTETSFLSDLIDS